VNGPRIALATGAVVFVTAAVGSVTGVWKALLYDPSGRSEAVQAVAGPLTFNAVIDANAKHIRDQVGADDQPATYLGHLQRLDALSDGIAPVAASTATMTDNVHALRGGLATVLANSQAIDRGLGTLAGTAATASGRLTTVAGSSASIAELMGLLGGATGGLGVAVGAIDDTAGTIAGTKLPAALASTKAIDDLLPKGVPAPIEQRP
jgi:hypothetical protein